MSVAFNPGDGKKRCAWVRGGSQAMHDYHDREWCAPMRDERALFEMLVLEGAQAGLSWETVIRKRENYRRAFAGFEPRKVAAFTRKKIDALLRDPGLIRNRLKIESAVRNADRFLRTAKEFGSFGDYLWGFVGEKQIQGRPPMPARTPLSDNLSKDLRRRGFTFVGPTIVYSYMQAAGLVNDHDPGCFRRAVCAKMRR